MTSQARSREATGDELHAKSSDGEAIHCENLGKAYAIYSTPLDRLMELLRPSGGHRGELFWALQGLSVSIRAGQAVGIIGRNGSGKSTLLQLIAGVLCPTEGAVRSQGRIAALLEIGTGFNPEFSGRENIHLGGSLLGLDPSTIEARIPDIENFADIGDFFDRPIKRYSSGMHARLAFSLIAHVDADVLIVDEALAVGDAAFSQKCMRFLHEFREKGTLCFVSHDTAAVINLCDTALWLEQGRARAFDQARAVCREYQESINAERRGGYQVKSPPPQVTAVHQAVSQSVTTTAETGEFDPHGPWHGFMGATIESASLAAASNPRQLQFCGDESVRLRVTVRSAQDLNSPVVGFSWKDARGQEIFGGNTLSVLSDDETLLAGDGMVTEFIFSMPNLCSGLYFITLAIAEGDQFNHIHHHWIDEAFTIKVHTVPNILGIMSIPYENKMFVTASIFSSYSG